MQPAKNESCLRDLRLLLGLCGVIPFFVRGEIEPSTAALFLDFESDQPRTKLFHGAKRVQGRFGGALEFNTSLQYAEVDFSRALDGTRALTIGGWFFPRRNGEPPHPILLPQRARMCPATPPQLQRRRKE